MEENFLVSVRPQDKPQKMNVVAHTYNPRTQEVEPGEWIQG